MSFLRIHHLRGEQWIRQRLLHISETYIFQFLYLLNGKVGSGKWKSVELSRVKVGNYYVSIEIISAGSGSADPVPCWVCWCGWCGSGDITYRILVICWVLVVVAETGAGAAQLSDPSPAWQPLVDQGQLTRPHLVSNHNTNPAPSLVIHRFQNRFSQSRRRPLLGPSPG